MDENNKIPTTNTPPIDSAEVPKEVQEQPKNIAQPTQAYVPKATATGEFKPGKFQKFKNFITECKRVLRVTKKPDKMEFKTIVKISGLGMAIIGFIGFFIHFAKELFF